jgi:hypothetical protein
MTVIFGTQIKGGLMKQTVIAVIVCAVMSSAAFAAGTQVVQVGGKDTKIHRIIGDNPGTMEVVSQYSSAIKLEALGKDKVAYWNPDGGKYVVSGDYAYIWCNIYKLKGGSSHYGWIAVNTGSLNEAISLAGKVPGGVAVYKLSSEGNKILIEAVTYDALHAMAQGQPVVDVKE